MAFCSRQLKDTLLDHERQRNLFENLAAYFKFRLGKFAMNRNTLKYMLCCIKKERRSRPALTNERFRVEIIFLDVQSSTKVMVLYATHYTAI